MKQFQYIILVNQLLLKELIYYIKHFIRYYLLDKSFMLDGLLSLDNQPELLSESINKRI